MIQAARTGSGPKASQTAQNPTQEANRLFSGTLAMLNFIRQRAGGTFSIVIIGAIAIVFIFWGIGTQDNSSQMSITMDGEPVSLSEFRRIQRNVLEQMRLSDPDITQEMETASYRRTLTVLLERHNLLKMANKFDLRVSDAQLNNYVKADPTFQVEGVFSLDRYKDAVTRQMGMTLPSYEKLMREDILINQMKKILTGLVHVPRSQILEEFHFATDRISLNYVQFNTADYLEEQTFTDEELATFYSLNREKYRLPEEIKVQYVDVSADKYMDQVEATTTEVEEAYTENLPSLSSPESAEVSHILILFENTQSPTADDEAKTVATAEEVLQRAKTEDFAELAKEVSQDTYSAEGGGDLGTVERNIDLPGFIEAVFGEGKDKLNEPIGPVRSPMGYHIIKVREYHPASVKSLEEANPELTEQVKLRKARALAAGEIERLEIAARYPTTLAEAAAALNLEPATSEFFSLNSGSPAFLNDQEQERQRAFTLDVGQLGYPVTGQSAYTLYSVVEKKPSSVPTMEDPETRAKAEKDLLFEKAQQKAMEETILFLEKAAAAGWEQASATLSETPKKGQSPLFRRLSLFEAGEPLIYSDINTLYKAIASLVKPGQTAAEPIPVLQTTPLGFMAVNLADFQAADEKEIDLPGGFSSEPIRMRLQETFYSYWLYVSNKEVDLRLPEELQPLIVGPNPVQQ